MTAAARSGPRTGAIAVIVDIESTLTPKQLELLALYASGFSYDEIGKAKFYSPLTVRNHLYRAVARSGARNVTHLAALAVERRIIVPSAVSGNFEPVQDLRIAGE